MNPDNNTIVEWDDIKFRASSWGNLLTEPVTKADKENGILSKTCQKELIKIYNQEVFGRKKEIVTRQMDKGIQAEPQSIALFSVIDGDVYTKNEEEWSNDFFKGHPDIVRMKESGNVEVWDIKTSWDLDSFMPKLMEEPDANYVAQLNCYYSLTGAQGGGIAYCLVSIPKNLLQEELMYLLKRMDVATELNPEYIKAAQELTKNLTFDDIPLELRLIKHPVPRNDDLIEKMKAKVPIFREWLQNFHEKHLSLNKKDLTLV
jgi:hypothetical protein